MSFRPRIVAGSVTLALALAAIGLVVASGAAFQEDPFPHEDHEGLFPLCTGCHEGVPSGDVATRYPEAELCVRCHDGEQEERVDWSAPTETVDNVRFDHVEHRAQLAEEGDPAQVCESCHTVTDGKRMSVGEAPELTACWSCHEHKAEDHFTDAKCESCHLTLAESGFGLARLEELPVPQDHEDASFLEEEHGSQASSGSARCATCHTADRCTACHVDGDLPEIASIPLAPDGMELPPAVAEYPEPSSHVDEGWLSAHSRQAPVGDCSSCHTREDCQVCHVRSLPDLAAALPSRADVRAPGVRVEAHAPESHESSFFMDAHGTLSAADGTSCATCHTESYCVECHEGPSEGGYHPPSFVARHAADAFGRDTECASCHNTAAFCRVCHERSGLGSEGNLGAGYHDAEPLWLLRHGQAARQNLESCASCHQQNDCVQCHGVLGAFKVSPHSRDFDAREAWARSPRICLACHVSNPIGGGVP
jgi:hypothetical protein